MPFASETLLTDPAARPARPPVAALTRYFRSQIWHPATRNGRPVLQGISWALVLVGAATAALLALTPHSLPPTLVPLIYLLTVIIAATRWGIWSAAIAAVAGAAAADIFFLPPYYSLRIDDPQQLVELLLFLAVALICSNLAGRVRQEADISRRREHEVGSLYEFSRRLARCFTVDDLLDATQRYVSRLLGHATMLFLAASDGGPGADGTPAIPEVIKGEIAMLAGGTDSRSKTIVEASSGRRWILKPLIWNGTHHGVIAVDLGEDAQDTANGLLPRIENAIEEAAQALVRIDIGNAMHEARQRLQEQLLKEALHGLVSHELRTPLASILGTTSVLDAMLATRGDAETRALVGAIREDASELDDFLATLLTASRVNSAGLTPRTDWVDPIDIVNAALARRARRLTRHVVEPQFGDSLPLVEVDPVMIEEACGQLIDNAIKYSTPGSRITVSAEATAADGVLLSVLDEGSGLAPEEIGNLGQRSFRGQRHRRSTQGFGLGLWIVSTFVRANGGDFRIGNRAGSTGTVASIHLPAGGRQRRGTAG